MGPWKIGEQERDLRIVVFEARDPGCGEEDVRGRCVRDRQQLFPRARSARTVVRKTSKGLLALSAASHLPGDSCQAAGWGSGSPGAPSVPPPPVQVGRVEWPVTLTSHWLYGPIASHGLSLNRHFCTKDVVPW